MGGASIGRSFVTPITHWEPTSIAPSGLAIHTGTGFAQWRGDFFIGALAGPATLVATLMAARAAAQMSTSRT